MVKKQTEKNTSMMLLGLLFVCSFFATISFEQAHATINDGHETIGAIVAEQKLTNANNADTQRPPQKDQSGNQDVYIQLKLVGGSLTLKDNEGRAVTTVYDNATLEVRVPFEKLVDATSSSEARKKLLDLKDSAEPSSTLSNDFFNGYDIITGIDPQQVISAALTDKDSADNSDKIQFVHVLDGGYGPNFRNNIGAFGYASLLPLLKKQKFVTVYRYPSKRRVKVRIRSRKGVRYAYKTRRDYGYRRKKIYGQRLLISGLQYQGTTIRSLLSAPNAEDMDQGFEPGETPIDDNNVNTENTNDKVIDINEDENGNQTAVDSNGQPLSNISLSATTEKLSQNSRIHNAIVYLQKIVQSGPTGLCFRYIKSALVSAGLAKDYPDGEAAKNAGSQLSRENFLNILEVPALREKIKSPFDAPAGSILVYEPTDRSPYGHIEWRTEDGFISDFFSTKPRTGTNSDSLSGRGRKLIGVYVLKDAIAAFEKPSK